MNENQEMFFEILSNKMKEDKTLKEVTQEIYNLLMATTGMRVEDIEDVCHHIESIARLVE